MKKYAQNLLLALIALCAVGTSPAHAEVGPPRGSFFDAQYYLGDDASGYPVYYMDYFGYFTYDFSDDYYVYKYDFGFLYYFGGSDPSGNNDAYFYDFTADDVFYTAPELYPYFYSFNREDFIYYFEGSNPREFYDFASGQYIYY